MTLTLNEYQESTVATALYPDALTGSVAAVLYCALGLGEAGEVQGKVKKIIRDDGSVITPEKRVEIAGELGDVLWYVARLAAELGYTFEEIAQANIDKLESRRERGVVTGSGDNR
jgi:NTP pyrophosphatase (non-canonical NTP hydrolase)